MGIVGVTNVKLSFFGAGLIQDELEYKFNMKGWFTFHEFLMRINKDVPFFVGANYVYFSNNVKFNFEKNVYFCDLRQTFCLVTFLLKHKVGKFTGQKFGK